MNGASQANLHSASLIGNESATWMRSGRLDEHQQEVRSSLQNDLD